MRSKPFKARLMTFGESCCFKIRSNEPVSDTSDGETTKLARAVTRMPTAYKWSKDALSVVVSTPYSLHVPKLLEVVFREVAEAQDPPLNPEVALSRQVYIKPSDIESNGLTRGCPKCDHELTYGPGRTYKGHSKVCRDRVMGELAKTVEGRIRIAAAAAHMDQTLAELGQQHRADLPQGEMADANAVGQDQP